MCLVYFGTDKKGTGVEAKKAFLKKHLSLLRVIMIAAKLYIVVN